MEITTQQSQIVSRKSKPPIEISITVQYQWHTVSYREVAEWETLIEEATALAALVVEEAPRPMTKQKEEDA